MNNSSFFFSIFFYDIIIYIHLYSHEMIKIHDKEIEEGNIEYKRFFENISLNKLTHLSAQMNWRINEGNGEAYYYLGICDNGTICMDLTQERIDYSLDVIKAMVENCNSYIDSMTIHRIKSHLWFDIYVKRMPEYTAEYRILVRNPNIMKIFSDYIKTGPTSYYTVYHNNEKYLFFESDMYNITELIDFNIIIDTNDYNNIEGLIDSISPNMKGNIIPCKKNIIFNVIEKHYIPSIGTILYGFLKDGYIEKGSIINNEWKVRSIHYNMKDCKNIIAPRIISISVQPNHL
jgi:hypothetical protein